jgi:hypothetical protein
MGGGLVAAQEVLTSPNYIRRTAVWVIILLSDGAANVTPRANRAASGALTNVGSDEYGYYGYCPWWTFCNPSLDASQKDPECTEYDPSLTGPSQSPYCSDGDPFTRHFCMTADGSIAIDAPGCDPARYDATDYAMDMADFAGLVEVRNNVAGNFIAMYSIGFGAPTENATSRLGEATLRYIADAGDNGRIDNDYQEDCRDNGNCGDWANPEVVFAPPDPCQDAAFHEDCGQYWYADNADDLERVFSEIASRLFTRLAR